jgi:hypothetical protein
MDGMKSRMDHYVLQHSAAAAKIQENSCMVSVSYTELSLYLFTHFHDAFYSIHNNKVNNLAPTLHTFHTLIRQL